MSEVRQEDVEELLPFVEEAANALKYIRPDAVPWFTKACVSSFNNNLFREVCKYGDIIPVEKREGLGLKRDAYLTYEAYQALTPLGRSIYKYALEVTCLRIVRNYYRDQHTNSRIDLFNSWRGFTIQTYKLSSLSDCCKIAQAYLGVELAFADLPKLPMNGCDHECCPCDYVLVDQLSPLTPSNGP